MFDLDFVCDFNKELQSDQRLVDGCLNLTMGSIKAKNFDKDNIKATVSILLLTNELSDVAVSEYVKRISSKITDILDLVNISDADHEEIIRSLRDDVKGLKNKEEGVIGLNVEFLINEDKELIIRSWSSIYKRSDSINYH